MRDTLERKGKMGDNSSGTLILIVVAVVALLFILGGCSLSCSKNKEGFTVAGLGGQCYGFQRTPVDYAMKYPHGWQRNPHFKIEPSNEHQPLEYGPIDFWKDSRVLADGQLFRQYRNDWASCTGSGDGRQLGSVANDAKNRFDLTQNGLEGPRRMLDNAYNPRFGPKGPSFTSMNLMEPNPYFGKLYGGSSFLYRQMLNN